MKSIYKSKNQNDSHAKYRIYLSVGGIIVNLLLSFIMYKAGFPLYFDSLGTITVAALSGYLFPAICTAVLSTTLCSIFYGPSIYLSFFNSIIAFLAVYFVRKRAFRKAGKTIIFIIVSAIISSLAASILQYVLTGKEAVTLVTKNALSLSASVKLPYLLVFWSINFLLYIVEKSFICIIVSVLLSALPKGFEKYFAESSWNSRVFGSVEQQLGKLHSKAMEHPLHARIARTFIVTSSLLVVIVGTISLKLYFDNTKKEKTISAWNCVKFAASEIDPLRVDDFIKYGWDAKDYKETFNKFRKIKNSFSDVQYLYALRIEENGGRFFIDTDEEEPYQIGELVPFEKELQPYLPKFHEGKEIEPIVTNNLFGWLLSVYYPVFTDEGRCVCYVGADVSIAYIAEYLGSFILKVILIMSGFYLVIISYTIWFTGNRLSHPISAMSQYIELFSDSVETQEKLEENVKLFRKINIHTGDEIQKLYDAICRMMLEQSEQLSDIRRLSDSTVKMQDGLIITMADLVENRDSDTGAHVQKTSAYVKIIVEGLREKGYYPQKITAKFISDVVRSAPLHDVGKINIPDSVLNKPGKLTDEEFAIMKTHTTAGKAILEKAISTVQGESYLKEARNMAAYHHERWDGKGYPEGLHGEVIPLSARIMAVADVFDALASPRVYKPAFPLEKALAILQEGSGTQFDPKCVEVFMESLPEVQMVLKKYSGGNLVL